MRPPCFAQLGSLGDLITPDVDIRFAGKHIRPRALAGIADESVSLHVAHDGMRGPATCTMPVRHCGQIASVADMQDPR